ncbi:MAG: phosphoribosylglycinamide formyltransferase [Lachnospiraceae bacterium]|nr:phosphoribosylglycinamide formyltransferase [Lachnospiraceae bacterium]
MLKVAVLVSGGGTNLQALIDSIGNGSIKNAEIVRVISSKKGVRALERAEKAGIDAMVVARRDYDSAEAFDKALTAALKECGAELIVLAGYLSVLSPELVRNYENRIINIHPSLIPAFCGVGYYGLKVHEEALARGVKVTGATVHFVDEGCDSGPIILQKSVEVREDDTPETLQRRVMEEAEWKLLPEAVDLIAAGKVRVENRKTYIS